MKKITTITLLASSLLLAEGHYAVKSAKIEFDIKSTQTVGNISSSKIGKKRIVIDNYGEQELEELNTVDKTTANGKTKIAKFHYIKYLNGDIRYVADFNKKTMNRTTGYMGMLYGTKKYKGSVDKMLELQKMKKIGTDTVAGHTCDVWQLGKISKTCFYKGFPLRTESTLMGMKRVVEATKAVFDIQLTQDDFKMPDFPVYEMDMHTGKRKNLSKDDLEVMDKKYSKAASEEKNEADMMIAIMKEAYTKAGVVKGKRPSTEQMKRVKEYIQKRTFPIQKKKFLEETKDMKNIKECLEKANSVKDANHCDPEGDSDRYENWNSTVKKETLKEIAMFETTILPCVEKSQNGKEMQMCFPKGY